MALRLATTVDANVAIFIGDLPDEYLRCRRYQHAWDPYTAARKKGRFEVALRCSRCEAFQYQVISLTGRLVKPPSRAYPPGYLSTVGRLDDDARALLRLEEMTRLTRRSKKAS